VVGDDLKLRFPRPELSNSRLRITGVRGRKWSPEQILQEDAQTASLSPFPFPFEIDNLASSWGERGCISCRAAPKSGTTIMCQPCHDRALRVAPVIIEVPEDHENFKSGYTVGNQLFFP
jgi:hypothetical protein